jgi:uncharacterized membrane-anchored protein YitT (DUF2179 family)
MKNKIYTHLFAVGIGVIGSLIFRYYFTFEDPNLVLVVFYFICLILGIVFYFVLFFWEARSTDLASTFKTSQDALVNALKTSENELVSRIEKIIGAHGKNLEDGIEGVKNAGREYNLRAKSYFDLKSALAELIRYHVYTAAIRLLHQSLNAEKAEKFVAKELEILEKIEGGNDVKELTGGRAYAQEQAYNTMLGRLNNGTLKPKTAFFKCKNCGGELNACTACGGELERRFK